MKYVFVILALLIATASFAQREIINPQTFFDSRTLRERQSPMYMVEVVLFQSCTQGLFIALRDPESIKEPHLQSCFVFAETSVQEMEVSK